jgi:uncharacterized protein (TIGR03545 family)
VSNGEEEKNNEEEIKDEETEIEETDNEETTGEEPNKENTKKGKPAKIPGSLKKPIKSKKFEKYFVKYIEHPQDRKFFISCYDKQDNNYVIHENLTKNDIKRIKNIRKWVKKNHKGPINFIPIAVASAIIAVFVILFTVFANPLLEGLMEKGLEAIFEAKSDVDNFRLSLIRFRGSISGITVANRDSPMTNLFQTGRTEIRLKPAAVLQGKIYIEEIRADTIRFGTERSVSGALPERPSRGKAAREETDAPPLIDLRNFDVMALINAEYDKLNSPKLYDDAINAYNTAVAKWQEQVESSKKKIEELKTASQPVLNINVNSLNDPQAIRNTIQDINNMTAAYQSAGDMAGNILSGIESDVKYAVQLEQDARDALANDINKLKSYVDLGSGAAFSALEPFIRDTLSDTAEKYLDYGIIALNALEKLKAISETLPKSDKPVKQPAFKGRDVVFPSVSYPKFFLGIFASDFTLDTWNYAFDLRDVSSNPDLTNKPVTLALGLTESEGVLQRKANLNASADFRTNPKERFSAILNCFSFPVSLRNQLSRVGINGFTGNSDFSVSLSGFTDGGFSAGGDIGITNAMLIDPKGTLAEAAGIAVSEAEIIKLAFNYIHNIGSNDEFKINTNIAELITQAVRRIAETYVQRAMDEIERELRRKINSYIDGRFVNKDELDLIFKTAKGDKEAFDQLKTALDKKKEELEQKLKNEGTKQIEQTIQSNIPSLPTLRPPR